MRRGGEPWPAAASARAPHTPPRPAPPAPAQIFVGGLPHTLMEDQVKELLLAFGPLAGFHLVREPGATTSKGYAFVEWADPAAGELAITGLHGMVIGDKTLTCRRSQAAVATIERAVAQGVPLQGVDAQAALAQAAAAAAAQAAAAPPASLGLGGVGLGLGGFGGGGSALGLGLGAQLGLGAAALLQGLPLAGGGAGGGALGAISGAPLQPPPPPPPPPLPPPSAAAAAPTRLLRLSNMLTAAEAADTREYADILADVKEELSGFGQLAAVVIPRSGPLVGNVYVEFAAVSSAAAAAAAMGGRTFASRRVDAGFEDPAFLSTSAHLLR